MKLEIAKLIDLEQAVQDRERLRSEGMRLVMTNGCFDLLHVGHIYFLKKAAELGDRLWVLLNNDTSVQALKGPARPIESENERAFSLAALECVARVVIFRKPDLVDEIKLIRPDIYAKAGDYTLETLHPGERRAFEQAGSEIRFLPFLEGFSTTAMIAKIKEAGSL